MGDQPAKSRLIWYIVQNSGINDPESETHGIYFGHKLEPEFALPHANLGGYVAPWIYGGGADASTPYQLISYSIDKKDGVGVIDGDYLDNLLGIPAGVNYDDLTGEQKALLYYPIDLKKYVEIGFDNLVLYYAFPEGGPNLSIVAMVKGITQDKVLGPVDPTQAGIPGTDAACPIASAERIAFIQPGQDEGDATPFPLELLKWQPDGIVRNNRPERGAWNTESIGGEEFIRLTVKPTLVHGTPEKTYVFDHWEHRTRNQQKAGPDISSDKVYDMLAQDFAGIVAFYKLPEIRGVPPVRGKDLKPVPTPPEGDWSFPGWLSLVAHQVRYDVEDLARGVLRLLRHAPGTRGHGEEVAAPTIDSATHARIVELAKSYPNDKGELERILSSLHE